MWNNFYFSIFNRKLFSFLFSRNFQFNIQRRWARMRAKNNYIISNFYYSLILHTSHTIDTYVMLRLLLLLLLHCGKTILHNINKWMNKWKYVFDGNFNMHVVLSEKWNCSLFFSFEHNTKHVVISEFMKEISMLFKEEWKCNLITSMMWNFINFQTMKKNL
jgi:hypothetical protein